MPTTRFCALGTLMGCLAGITGCNEQPEDRFFFVDRVRVLSVRAQPLTALKGEDVRFEVLARAPDGGAFTQAWRWCPYQGRARDRYACPVTRERYESLISAAAQRFGLPIPPTFWSRVPAFEIEGGAQAVLRQNLAPEEALVLCTLGQYVVLEDAPDLQDVLHTNDCAQGFEVSLHVDLTHTPSAQTLNTRKSMFWDTGQYNPLRNPELSSFQIRPLDEADAEAIAAQVEWLDASKPHDEQWVTPFDGIQLPEEHSYEVRLAVREESLDFFQPQRQLEEDDGSFGAPRRRRDLFDNPPSTLALERVDYRFFTTMDVVTELPAEEDDDDDDGRGPDTDRFTELQPLELERSFVLNFASEGQGVREVCKDQAACTGWFTMIAKDKQLGLAWGAFSFEVLRQGAP